MQGNSIYGTFLYHEIAFQTEILLEIKSAVYSAILLKTYTGILYKNLCKIKITFFIIHFRTIYLQLLFRMFDLSQVL